MTHHSKVRVIQKDDKGLWRTIHTGVVVGASTSMLRIYNPITDSEGGAERAEWFALNSTRVKILEF